MEQGNKGMKKLIVILAVLAGISVAVCIVSIMMYFHKGKDSVTELLDLGQTYLEDGKYEQAVASLEAVLRIDPKDAKTDEERKVLEDKGAIAEQLADAYLAWADDEVAKGDKNQALNIIKEGQKKIKGNKNNGDAMKKAYSAMLLKEYAMGKSYLGERKEEFSGYIEWMENDYWDAGFPEFSCDDVPVEPLTYRIDDYDQDGEMELLVVTADDEYRAGLQMYEVDENEVKQQATVDYFVSREDLIEYLHSGVTREEAELKCLVYDYIWKKDDRFGRI